MPYPRLEICPDDKGIDRPHIVSRWCSRVGGGWFDWQSSEPANRDLGEVGEPLNKKYLPRGWPEPGVWFGGGMSSLRQESFSETWASFFPRIPDADREKFQYPAPFEPAFWHHYAEPVRDFVYRARKFRTAVEGIRYWKETPQSERQGPVTLTEALNFLTAPVRWSAHPMEDGSIRGRWVSPSLFATLAMMLVQDLSDQSRILNCQNCQRFFVTSAYQREYCSDRCRRTAQKRRYRAKKREAKNG